MRFENEFEYENEYENENEYDYGMDSLGSSSEKCPINPAIMETIPKRISFPGRTSSA